MYTPISSEFFDQLIVAMERRIPSTVIYEDNGKELTAKGVVKTLEMHEGKEYLVLEDGQTIALHLVYTFNGKKHRKIDIV